jgi:D-aminoacyl-tRNA deacylase
MYKKILIVASKLDKAGINITTQLSKFGKYDFYLVEKETIFTENLDLEKINRYDFIVFASKHASNKKEKTLSVHAPGNWRLAEFGGEKGKVCKTSAFFIKQFFEELHKNVKEYNLKDYKVTLEATHHGPLIDKPCVFVEIGSTENEWKDRKAGFVLARALHETLKNLKPNPYNEVAIGIGGPHYCPNFNKIQLNSNIAVSHIISQYAFPITEEMVKEAIEKTDEEVDLVLLDWKGLGKSEERKKIIEILDKLHVDYRRTSEV